LWRSSPRAREAQREFADSEAGLPGLIRLMHRVLHCFHLPVIEHGKEFVPLPLRKLPVIVQAALNEQIDQAVRHIRNFLDREFGRVVVH
jgi:hypothetical protein